MGFGQSAWKLEKIQLGQEKNGHYILGTGKRLGNRGSVVREVIGLDYRHLECPSK